VTARILIVDDEPALRHTLDRVVSSLGFDVVAVGEASLAYEMLNGGMFDLVLLDLHLPQISGDALYLALVRRWPRLRGRIVLMTGDPTAVRSDWPTELIDCPVLSKPFTLDALKSALRGTLAAAQAAEARRRAEGQA
jgi:two-component system, NtrC family, response regulator AtoC